MNRWSLGSCSLLAFAISLGAAEAPSSGPGLSAADIVNRNIEARGGLQEAR